MREKTLLLLVASDRRRGAEVFGERLGDGLRKRGWDVDFVAIQASGADRIVTAEPLAPPEATGRLNRHTIAALRKRMAARKPAIVLANGGATLRYDRGLATFARIEGHCRQRSRRRGDTRLRSCF